MLNGVCFNLFTNILKLIKKDDSLERNIRVYGLRIRAAHACTQIYTYTIMANNTK